MSDVIFPIDPSYSYQVNSIFGWRDDPLHPDQKQYHGGVDIKGTSGNPIDGAPVLSMGAGKVIYSGKLNDTYGNIVVIQNVDGTSFLYAHMQDGSTSNIHKGDYISQGSRIGNVGSTGRATGPHLHLEVLTSAASYDIFTKGTSTSLGIVPDSKLLASASPQRINPIDTLDSASRNAKFGLDVTFDNPSDYGNGISSIKNILSGNNDASDIFSQFNTSAVNLVDSFSGQSSLFSTYSNDAFSKAWEAFGITSNVKDSGWSGLGSYNSFLDDYTFNSGGGSYTLFGQNDRITLPSLSSDSGFGSPASNFWKVNDAYSSSWGNFLNAQNRISPLILDLNSNGIETTSLNATNVFFDIDGDGFAQKVGWVKPTEGLLAIDTNNNGVIDDITELFR